MESVTELATRVATEDADDDLVRHEVVITDIGIKLLAIDAAWSWEEEIDNLDLFKSVYFQVYKKLTDSVRVGYVRTFCCSEEVVKKEGQESG